MEPGPKIPTVAETLKHPAFPTAIWKLEPDRKGLAPVAEGRGGPLKISWEIHGEGPTKLIFIMGLGGLKTGWQRQTLYFGHEHRDKYSVLIYDNRGVGDSDKPLMRYSSSEMARDLCEVLASPEVGWLPSFPLPKNYAEPRSLHVTGISLGGMIAQEFACLVAPAISTLNLCCTCAAIENTTTFAENIANRISMLMPKSIDRSVADTARQVFAHDWLVAKDTSPVPIVGVTPKALPPNENQKEYLKFDTNAQRFVAQEMSKRMDPARFGLKGFLLQLIAAGWHHKTKEQLQKMADDVGRERILIMHGTEDKMITVPHGKKLIEFINPGVGMILDNAGHAPPIERVEWFNNLVAERAAMGEKLDGRA
ncbi:hypothetical protein QBC35DRAFT_505821 [Podospora australis]|uniref:AB hydrolase-1 domain-containing protein n=1 Tax=Podospora australis TaxID=1536484 RepID=A0AAN7AFZ7_9PEZI|nr:hypothetical protein QBC35DRAFT_505821 [Podospora australis]